MDSFGLPLFYTVEHLRMWMLGFKCKYSCWESQNRRKHCQVNFYFSGFLWNVRFLFLANIFTMKDGIKFSIGTTIKATQAKNSRKVKRTIELLYGAELLHRAVCLCSMCCIPYKFFRLFAVRTNKKDKWNWIVYSGGISSHFFLHICQTHTTPHHMDTGYTTHELVLLVILCNIYHTGCFYITCQYLRWIFDFVPKILWL